MFHCMCISHLFIHSSLGGHLGYFHFLAIVNNASNEHGCTNNCLVLAFNSVCIYAETVLLDQR